MNPSVPLLNNALEHVAVVCVGLDSRWSAVTNERAATTGTRADETGWKKTRDPLQLAELLRDQPPSPLFLSKISLECTQRIDRATDRLVHWDYQTTYRTVKCLEWWHWQLSSAGGNHSFWSESFTFLRMRLLEDTSSLTIASAGSSLASHKGSFWRLLELSARRVPP